LYIYRFMHRAAVMHDYDPFTTPTRQPSTPPIFLRDFAYPQSARVVLPEPSRMSPTHGIGSSPARLFARYVEPSVAP